MLRLALIIALSCAFLTADTSDVNAELDPCVKYRQHEMIFLMEACYQAIGRVLVKSGGCASYSKNSDYGKCLLGLARGECFKIWRNIPNYRDKSDAIDMCTTDVAHAIIAIVRSSSYSH